MAGLKLCLDSKNLENVGVSKLLHIDSEFRDYYFSEFRSENVLFLASVKQYVKIVNHLSNSQKDFEYPKTNIGPSAK